MSGIRIIGGGWYGSHLCAVLARDGYEVSLHERAGQLFAGASGANPARLHQGFHYPRSRLTRAACLDNASAFMGAYGHFTRPVPVNLYAVASDGLSLVDFGTYRDTMRSSGVEFISVRNPGEFGLHRVEGALLTGERHVVIRKAREHFEAAIGDLVTFNSPAPELLDDPAYALTIDCTFCALDAEAIDRYEPCLTVILQGPTDRAVTIMDGPFPSIYPWDEEAGLSSLTSAFFTPISKECRSWAEARELADSQSPEAIRERSLAMLAQMREFYRGADLYKIADAKLSVRAMPKSSADARLVDLVRIGPRAVRLRAGKIDAVFRAEALVREVLACL